MSRCIYFLYFLIQISLFVPAPKISTFGTSTLKQLHVIFRHGERTPSSSYPTDPYKDVKWPEGYGRLTKRGKYEMYQLGEQLLESYQSFIPIYSPENVYVQSSYSDRCLMSAELVAAAMFPPQNEQIWNDKLLWQPIPIHYLPRSVDNNIAMKSKCPTYDKEFKEMLRSPEVQQILRTHSDLLKFLTEKTGENIDTIEDVEGIYNILMMEEASGFPLPDWANNETLLSEMHNLAATNLALYSKTQRMKRLKGGKLLRDIVTSMNKIINGTKEPSVMLWSAHDLTLVHVGRALDIFDIHKPGYAANLILELHADQEVKVRYQDYLKDTGEEYFIKNCSSPCHLEQLKQALDAVLPKDWVMECRQGSG